MKKLLVFLVLLGPALCLRAQEADTVAAQKARITAERAQAHSVFAAEEKACFRKFAVNDCVNEARSKQREVLADLRRQEIDINDAERRRKAAERLRDIEERNSGEAQRGEAERRAKALAEQRDLETRASAKASDRASRDAAGSAKAASREEQAERQKDKLDAARDQRDEQAARQRKQQEQRLAQAQERKAKYEKRLAERKKPAAKPLPVPP